jgi:hypothetical protein
VHALVAHKDQIQPSRTKYQLLPFIFFYVFYYPFLSFFCVEFFPFLAPWDQLLVDLRTFAARGEQPSGAAKQARASATLGLDGLHGDGPGPRSLCPSHERSKDLAVADPYFLFFFSLLRLDLPNCLEAGSIFTMGSTMKTKPAPPPITKNNTINALIQSLASLSLFAISISNKPC